MNSGAKGGIPVEEPLAANRKKKSTASAVADRGLRSRLELDASDIRRRRLAGVIGDAASTTACRRK